MNTSGRQFVSRARGEREREREEGRGVGEGRGSINEARVV